jgi:hypothetical protein
MHGDARDILSTYAFLRPLDWPSETLLPALSSICHFCQKGDGTRIVACAQDTRSAETAMLHMPHYGTFGLRTTEIRNCLNGCVCDGPTPEPDTKLRSAECLHAGGYRLLMLPQRFSVDWACSLAVLLPTIPLSGHFHVSCSTNCH